MGYSFLSAGAPNPPLARRMREVNLTRLYHFRNIRVESGGLRLGGMFNLPLDAWSSLQLGHYLGSLSCVLGDLRELTVFEHLCLTDKPTKHTLANVMGGLRSPRATHPPHFIRQWKQDLGLSLSKKQIDRMLYFAHKSSVSNRYQEAGYKLILPGGH